MSHTFAIMEERNDIVIYQSEDLKRAMGLLENVFNKESLVC